MGQRFSSANHDHEKNGESNGQKTNDLDPDSDPDQACAWAAPSTLTSSLNLESEPEPINPIEFLSPEILNNIFSFLTFNEKKTIRLCCKFWKNIVSTRPELSFRVKLNNHTAKFVLDPTFSFNLVEWKLHYLVENFTLAPNSESNFQLFAFFNSKHSNIAAITFGTGNSAECLGKILEICSQKKVEKLTFRCNSLTPLLGERELENGQNWDWNLYNLKTFEIEIGRDVCPNSASTTSIIPDFDVNHASLSWNIFTFLNNLIMPSLETVIVTTMHGKDPSPANAHRIVSQTIKFLNQQCKTIKTLTFNMRVGKRSNFHRMTIPTLSGVPLLDCPNLQQLRVDGYMSCLYVVFHLAKLTGLKSLEINCPALEQNAISLISDNSTTLKSLVIQSLGIRLVDIALGNCTFLKKLSLFPKSMHLYDIPDPIPVPAQTLFPTSLRTLIFSASSGDKRFDVLKKLLEHMGEFVEEVIVIDLNEYIGWSQLQWILSRPQMKKIVLSGLHHKTAKFIDRCCKKQIVADPDNDSNRLSFSIVNRNSSVTNNDKVDFCIRVLD